MERKRIRGKKQVRLIPLYNRSNEFKKRLSNKYLENWPYAAHWVDSALKTAYPIMDSWRRNYVKGKRKRSKPVARGLFLRVKQTNGCLLRLLHLHRHASAGKRTFFMTSMHMTGMLMHTCACPRKVKLLKLIALA